MSAAADRCVRCPDRRLISVHATDDSRLALKSGDGALCARCVDDIRLGPDRLRTATEEALSPVRRESDDALVRAALAENARRRKAPELVTGDQRPVLVEETSAPAPRPAEPPARVVAKAAPLPVAPSPAPEWRREAAARRRHILAAQAARAGLTAPPRVSRDPEPARPPTNTKRGAWDITLPSDDPKIEADRAALRNYLGRRTNTR